MQRGVDVLAELDELVNDAPKPVVMQVEEVQLESGPPSAAMRDARGPLMTEAVDRVVGGLDRLATSLETAVKTIHEVKADLLEMKKIWENPVVENDPAHQEDDDGEVPEAP